MPLRTLFGALCLCLLLLSSSMSVLANSSRNSRQASSDAHSRDQRHHTRHDDKPLEPPPRVRFGLSPSHLAVREDGLGCDPLWNTKTKEQSSKNKNSNATEDKHSNDKDGKLVARIQHVELVAAHLHGAVDPPSFLFRGALPNRDNFASPERGGKGVTAEEDYHSNFLPNILLANLRARAAEVARSSSVRKHNPSLARLAKRFPRHDADVFLLDVSLLWDSRGDDAARLRAERSWFDKHDGDGDKRYARGEFHHWPTYGTRNNASKEYTANTRLVVFNPEDVEGSAPPAENDEAGRRLRNNSALAAALRAGDVPKGYETPDHLDERVLQLRRWLRHRRAPSGPHGCARSLVIYVHCYCGSDRTGELMGAWALAGGSVAQGHGRNWREVNEENTRIAGRPVGCRNYRAMQWYCFEQEGIRQEELGCEENFPCAVFV
jgi:hypothetical protein